MRSKFLDAHNSRHKDINIITQVVMHRQGMDQRLEESDPGLKMFRHSLTQRKLKPKAPGLLLLSYVKSKRLQGSRYSADTFRLSTLSIPSQWETLIKGFSHTFTEAVWADKYLLFALWPQGQELEIVDLDAQWTSSLWGFIMDYHLFSFSVLKITLLPPEL